MHVRQPHSKELSLRYHLLTAAILAWASVTQAQFEALGSVVAADDVPAWGESGANLPALAPDSRGREMAVRYVNRTRELTIFAMPRGRSTVEIFNLNGRTGARRIQVIANVAEGKQTFRIETIRPGYYIARVKTPSRSMEIVRAYPFVI